MALESPVILDITPIENPYYPPLVPHTRSTIVYTRYIEVLGYETAVRQLYREALVRHESTEYEEERRNIL